MSILPYDVLENISEIIKGDGGVGDYRTLYAMSLTCRNMLEICRKQLFYEMVLVPRSWDSLSYTTTPRSFRLKMIAQNPTMFRIKDVEHLAESNSDILKNVQRLYVHSSQSNYNDIGLHALLQKFDNLQFLSIEESFWKTSEHLPPHLSWNSLPSSYQLALAQLIRRSPLRSLSLNEYKDIPVDIILSLRSLLHLFLKRTSFSLDNCPSPSVLGAHKGIYAAPLQLQELWLSSCIEDLSRLLDDNRICGHPIIDPTALELLVIELETVGDILWDRNVLKKISNLEFLFISDPEISYQNYLSDVLHGLHPQSISSLVFFRYDITYNASNDERKPLPSSVIRNFTFDTLETLEINLGIHRSHHEASILEDLSDLDRIIDNIRFPVLQNLKIRVTNLTASNVLAEANHWQSARSLIFINISGISSLSFDYSFDE